MKLFNAIGESSLVKFSITFHIFLISLNSEAQITQIDYSNERNWAVLPGKYPEALKEFEIKTSFDSVDVFYVYPTLIGSPEDTRWNVSIDDSVQRAKVLNSAVKFQASAWTEAGNIYAPYYRQAHLRSYYNLENGGREALLFAYEDVKAAFQYYLDHYNNGKAIILAGHSQGSTHLGFILRDFFDGKPLKEKLIAAYLPGIGFEKDLYQDIPLMLNKEEVGGFVTWNTFKKKFDEKQYPFYEGKAVVNPVTWDTIPIAERNLHQGFLFRNGKMYKHSFTTHLDNGVVWITTPRFPYRFVSFKMKHYHVGDINLFWEDIHQNSLLRVKRYFELSSLQKP